MQPKAVFPGLQALACQVWHNMQAAAKAVFVTLQLIHIQTDSTLVISIPMCTFCEDFHAAFQYPCVWVFALDDCASNRVLLATVVY